jgi:hypothetical protein
LKNFDGDREFLGEVEKFMLCMIVDPTSAGSSPLAAAWCNQSTQLVWLEHQSIDHSYATEKC